MLESEADSDSFPDLYDKFNIPRVQPEIKEGDIVWAKYRKLHWPAVVRKMYPKRKKVTVCYLDNHKNRFKVSRKDIHRFSDRLHNHDVLREGSKCPMKDLHEKVYELANDYLEKKSKSQELDLDDYFGPHLDSLIKLRAKCLSKMPENDTPRMPKNDNADLNTSSEDDSSSSDNQEEINRETSRIDAYVEKTNLPDSTVDAIVACIKAGQVNKHLSDVVSKKISSQKNDVFEKYLKEKDTRLLMANCPEITIIGEKFREINEYLEGFYYNENELIKTNYNLYVLYPHAVDYAAKLVDDSKQTISESAPQTKSEIFSPKLEEKPVNGITHSSTSGKIEEKLVPTFKDSSTESVLSHSNGNAYTQAVPIIKKKRGVKVIKTRSYSLRNSKCSDLETIKKSSVSEESNSYIQAVSSPKKKKVKKTH